MYIWMLHRAHSRSNRRVESLDEGIFEQCRKTLECEEQHCKEYVVTIMNVDLRELGDP